MFLSRIDIRSGLSALRARWIAGRVSLRKILGSALAMPAQDVPLVRGMRGRPAWGLGQATSAMRAASLAREAISSLRKMCDRWASTVRGETKSCSAI